MADTCGCCGPTTAPTPAAVENRPALSAISFRAGTYSSFLRAMIDRIARDTPPTDPENRVPTNPENHVWPRRF